MRLIGLSGGIATGKSTVSKIVSQEGIPVVDCDKIAHAVVKKGRWGYKRVLAAFGDGVLQADGDVDRAALGSLIFSNPTERKKLNKATHLPVYVEMCRQLLMHWLTCRAMVFVDMPLLFETGSYKSFSTTLLVTCSKETQIRRLMERDSCIQEQAQAKVSSQMPLEEKENLATNFIDNDSSREETHAQTKKFIKQARRHIFWHQWLLSPVALLAGIPLLWGILSLARR